MSGKMKHFKNISVVSGDIEIDINMSRFERQFQRAQYELDTMVMQSMKPYMPFNTGTFYNLTKQRSDAVAGTGQVIAAAPPYGRFLYMGKVMVDPATQSPWARKGAKKVTIDRSLTYSNPKATPFWFDTAKQKHGDEWIKKVKKTAGGG